MFVLSTFQTKQIRHGSSDKCLSITESKQRLLMEECSSSAPRQKWSFENYDPSKLWYQVSHRRQSTYNRGSYDTRSRITYQRYAAGRISGQIWSSKRFMNSHLTTALSNIRKTVGSFNNTWTLCSIKNVFHCLPRDWSDCDSGAWNLFSAQSHIYQFQDCASVTWSVDKFN